MFPRQETGGFILGKLIPVCLLTCKSSKASGSQPYQTQPHSFKILNKYFIILYLPEMEIQGQYNQPTHIILEIPI